MSDAYGTWPPVTLITPSFQQGQYIEETIRSVLLQGYPNLEYIVVDGGSTDETIQVLEKYSAWLTHWSSEPDRGQSHAINKGLKHASGVWFNWLCSDDTLKPGALKALMCSANGQPDAHVISGYTSNIRDGKIFSSYGAFVNPAWPSSLFTLRVNQPGSLVRLEIVKALGYIREDLSLTMDLDLWLGVMWSYGPSSFISIEIETATYRYHQDSKTCAGKDVFAGEEFALLYDLAVKAGVSESSQILSGIRNKISFKNSMYSSSVLSINSEEAEDAWLDRLVISDCLLFRSITHNHTVMAEALLEFRVLLVQLKPFLARGRSTRQLNMLLANALLRALQYAGQFDAGTAYHILTNALSVTNIRDLARLLLR